MTAVLDLLEYSGVIGSVVAVLSVIRFFFR
jgi:hypothetical protein